MGEVLVEELGSAMIEEIGRFGTGFNSRELEGRAGGRAGRRVGGRAGEQGGMRWGGSCGGHAVCWPCPHCSLPCKLLSHAAACCLPSGCCLLVIGCCCCRCCCRCHDPACWPPAYHRVHPQNAAVSGLLPSLCFWARRPSQAVAQQELAAAASLCCQLLPSRHAAEPRPYCCPSCLAVAVLQGGGSGGSGGCAHHVLPGGPGG